MQERPSRASSSSAQRCLGTRRAAGPAARGRKPGASGSSCRAARSRAWALSSAHCPEAAPAPSPCPASPTPLHCPRFPLPCPASPVCFPSSCFLPGPSVLPTAASLEGFLWPREEERQTPSPTQGTAAALCPGLQDTWRHACKPVCWDVAWGFRVCLLLPLCGVSVSGHASSKPWAVRASGQSPYSLLW